MNVALRLLMRKTSAAPVSPIRLKIATATTLTTTATFDESTPVDSTHLLVALVGIKATPAPASVSAGWTEISGGGNHSTAQVRMYVAQGDGSKNSFSVTRTTGTLNTRIYLMAFPGFVSTTALGSAGGSVFSLGTSSLTPTTGLGNGVIFMMTALASNVTAFGTYSGGYTTLTASQDNAAAWKPYDSADSSHASTITWTGSSDQVRRMWAVMPLA